MILTRVLFPGSIIAHERGDLSRIETNGNLIKSSYAPEKLAYTLATDDGSLFFFGAARGIC